MRSDGLGEKLGKTAGGGAEVDSSGSGGVEIVELRGDIGLEQGRGGQKVWAGRRPYGHGEGCRDREGCEGANGRRTADLCTDEWVATKERRQTFIDLIASCACSTDCICTYCMVCGSRS